MRHFAFLPTSRNFGFVRDCEITSVRLTPSLCECLNAVAAVPSLRSLRLLFAPGHDEEIENRKDSDWVEKAGQLAHHIAVLVMTHLRSKGSNITTLSLYPDFKWGFDVAHSSSHLFPHYLYELQVGAMDGTQDVNIRPVSDFLMEYPELQAFR